MATMGLSPRTSDISPIIRTAGNGGSISYDKLNDSKDYAHIEIYTPAITEQTPLPLQQVTQFTAGIPPLYSYFPLDEGSGSTANDLSGNTNSGTLVNSPQWQGGKTFCQFENCISFNSVSTQYIIGSSSPYNFPDSTFTVSCWFFTSTSGTMALVSNGGSSGGWELGLQNGKIYVITKSSTGFDVINTAIGASTYNNGLWHFVAAIFTTSTTVSSSNSVTAYVDGSLIGTVSSTTGKLYGSTSVNWSIASRSGGTSQYYNGRIDDVRIYNVGLSPANIQQQFAYKSNYASSQLQTVVEIYLPFDINPNISGTTVEWNAEWDTNATSNNYSLYPIGAESAPAGIDAVEITKNPVTGIWQAVSLADGHSTIVNLISTPTANVIHSFKIVFTVGGSQVDYYIDGTNVATITTNIPTITLSPFTELGNLSPNGQYANLWTMGGKVP